jgi:hypothetical protein
VAGCRTGHKDAVRSQPLVRIGSSEEMPYPPLARVSLPTLFGHTALCAGDDMVRAWPVGQSGPSST